jgi:hypothetical protein
MGCVGSAWIDGPLWVLPRSRPADARAQTEKSALRAVSSRAVSRGVRRSAAACNSTACRSTRAGRAQWHNPMKAPPCMRWRGLHLAFAVKAARFLGPLSHHSAFTELSDHLKRRLPDNSAAVSRPREVSPGSSDLSSVAFRLGDESFLLPPSGSRKGFDQHFQDSRSLHSSIHSIRLVIPRADKFLHRLSTSADEVRADRQGRFLDGDTRDPRPPRGGPPVGLTRRTGLAARPADC